MRKARAFFFVCAGLISLALLLPRLAVAAWPTDPLVNVPLGSTTGEQYNPAIVSDGAGGAIVTWSDRSMNEIYVQRISAGGTVLWTTDGVVLSTDATGYEQYPAIVSDGAGGAIVTWKDSYTSNWNIYAQRISAEGTVLWKANGVALCTAAGMQAYPMIASDGAGGAIVAWTDFGGANSDIYAQRISAGGTVQWTANGVALCTAAGNQYPGAIAPDGAGGAIVVWTDYRGDVLTHSSDIYAQRISAEGTVQWTVDGVGVCTHSGSQEYSRVVSDGAGGAIVTWEDDRGTGDIYAQRISADGTAQWTADGVAVCAATSWQTSPIIASNGTGGAIVVWIDHRSGTNCDIYAQEISAAGTTQWSADGVAICTATGDQQSPMIATDGAGGAIVAWQDSSGSSNDIYCQRISADGTAQWTANGVPLCTAPLGQYVPAIDSDGTGGAIVAWQDARSGRARICAQRISAGGAVQWTADGLPLCTPTGDQYSPTIVADGMGGAIVTWRDGRNGTSNYDIYAQRVSVNGAVAWAAGGVALCTATGDQQYPTIVADGAGGAIVTWRDGRSGAGNYDIYAQRVSVNGMVMWGASGVALCAAAGDRLDPRIVSDGAGGAIVTWWDYRSGDYHIYAQRISSGGTVEWTANGVAICTATGNQTSPVITSDGAGGAIVSWHDGRGTDSDIYAQRISSAGTVQWAANGVALCTATNNQTWPAITSDGVGGAIVTWMDYRSSNYPAYFADIYAQRISGEGTVQWVANGVALCTATGDQMNATTVSDGAGGAIVTWQDKRSSNYDIYAQRISADGTLQWPADGVALCTVAGGQYGPTIVPDDEGGAIVTWTDHRSGSSNDIYCQRISADGTVQWTADGVALCTSTGDHWRLAVVSDGKSGAIATWVDGRNLASDIYAQRVQANGQLGGYAGASVPAEAPLVFALDPVRPNPSRGGALAVHFTLASRVAASLELFDVAGRRIVAREVGSLGLGRHALDLGEGRRLAPGIYLVCLRQGTNTRVTRVVVLK